MKGRIIAPAILALFGLASLNLNAANLMDIYQAALENDAQFRAAESQLKASLEAVPQSRAGLLPNINLSGNTQWIDRESEGSPSTQEEFNSNGYSASLVQPLIRADRWFQFRAAKATNKQAYFVYEDAKQDLIIRVAEAYFNILRASDNLSSAIARETAFRRQLEQAQERFDVGLIAITDVYEAQAAYDLARVDRISQVEARDNSYAALETLTNSPYSDIDVLDKNIPIEGPNPVALNDWINVALENNALLNASRQQVKAAKEDIKQSKSGHLPTLDAVATYSHSESGGTSFLGSETDTTTYSLEFNIPIFQGGGTQSQVREAHYRHAQFQDEYENLYRVVKQNIQTQHRTLSTDVMRVGARKLALKSNIAALEATKGGYDVGTRNIVDVVQVENARFASESDYSNAIYDYIINSLNLNRIAGTLSEADLDELNRWLAPKTSTKNQGETTVNTP